MLQAPSEEQKGLHQAGDQTPKLMPTHMAALTWDTDTQAVLPDPQSHRAKLVPLEQQSN